MDAVLTGLLLSAFFGATLFPGGSEVLLAAAAHEGRHAAVLLWGVATVGNVAGAWVNALLGRQVGRWGQRRWFPLRGEAFRRAGDRYQRWGQWSLLLAWTPLLGDALTLMAGVFRLSWWRFLVLVTLGKGGRYALILYWMAP
ncbi:MAG: DedA family protein [Magnetococcus sp. WYHC-3]